MHDLSQIVKAYDVRGACPTSWTSVARALGAAFARCCATPAPRRSWSRTTCGHRAGAGRRLRRRGAGPGRDVVIDRAGLHRHALLRLRRAEPPARCSPPATTRPGTTASRCAVGRRPDRAGQRPGRHPPDRPRRCWTPVSRRPQPAAASAAPGPARRLRRLPARAGRPVGVRPLKVVVDAGNGMAGYTVPTVLGDAAACRACRWRSCRSTSSSTAPSPTTRPTRWTRRTCSTCRRAVVEHGADLGLAFDGDADRCFVVDERGEPVSPSAVTALVAARELARTPGHGDPQPDHLAGGAGDHRRARRRPVRTRVGHSFIKAEMARTRDLRR